MNVPERYVAHCAFCRELVDTRPGRGAYAGVTGYVPLRTDGGANQVALRRPNGLYACKGCVAVRALISPRDARFGEQLGLDL